MYKNSERYNMYRMMRALGDILVIITMLCVFNARTVMAAYLNDVPQTLTQPDGSVLNCYATGDEFYNWLHDENGFTIIQEKNGFYVYAVLENDRLAPSDEVAGKRYQTKEIKIRALNAKNLKTSANLSPKKIKEIRLKKAKRMKSKEKKLHLPDNKSGIAFSQDSITGEELQSSTNIMQAPHTGTLNNIVIFIRCSDQSEFTETISSYNGDFNSNTISMDNYFKEASYNALSISSTFYPVASGESVISYQDAHTRNYFRPYNLASNPSGYQTESERTQREHQLLADAVSAVSAEIPPELDVDRDDDGYVDNVVFIIQGETDGWSSLLWPHRWALYSVTAKINGARVWDYNFQLSEAFGVSVLCHEMFHSLGAPDLYHYSGDSLDPVGRWDLMEQNTSVPQHMTAYMKYRYGGWIHAIPEIAAPGGYSLSPLSISSTGNCYKIPSPNSLTEYFMVEYRNTAKGVFDQGIPGSGLLVYRINTIVDGEGNRNGPPDELYIFRPGGTVSNNGNLSRAHFSTETGRTYINSSTDPFPFLSSGDHGGLDISSIGSTGDTITFNVNMPDREIAVFVDETNIPNSTTAAIDFGFTSAGYPIIKTFTVSNSGYEILAINGLVVPEGYSLISAFPDTILPYSSDSFQVQLDAPVPGIYTGTISFNTNDADENPFNFPVSGNVTCVQEVLLSLTTDNYGEETTWELTDSQDNVLHSAGPYASGQSFSQTMMLPAGDYVFTMYDEYGDGICCDYGSGSYSLVNGSTGDVFIESGGEFGDQESTPFSIVIDQKGDIDGNCMVELTDAILGLQICAGLIPDVLINLDADVNGDTKIGLDESIYVLEKLAGVKE